MLNVHMENSNYEMRIRKLKESSEVCTGMVQFPREFWKMTGKLFFLTPNSYFFVAFKD